MAELMNTLLSYMRSLGVEEIKNSTKTHFRRKLEKEFGELLQFEDLLDNNKLFVIPKTLSKVELARSVARMAENEKNISASSKIEDIKQTAITIRMSILSRKCDMSWPPQPSELNESMLNIPEELAVFLSTLLSGNKEHEEAKNPQRLQRLVNSFGQDLIFGVSGGRQKTPKHILLPHAVKTLTNNIELIQILNRCGHGVAYSQIEEMNTALCLQKLSQVSLNEVPLPGNIHPYINTTLAWDNVDRLEETLSGEGTSHRVNGIAIQTRMFGPQLPPQPIPEVIKSKKRSIDCLTIPELPVYNAGERWGPLPRKYIEVTFEEIAQNARKKNLLWMLARLHANERQKVSGWTGFNISVRKGMQFPKDNIGYLPTINAPATNMSTVNEVLEQTLKIKASLKLQKIVVVFDQALYAKAIEIKWKHSEKFQSIILRMGVFHTICTMMSIIGKRFQDAGLKDLCIESDVIAEGSVAGVLDGRHYNRAVRFHKLTYEALMRLAWKGFLEWIDTGKKTEVKDAFESLQSLCENICEERFHQFMINPVFSRLFCLFDKYLEHLRKEKGKLAQFWMSYIDMVDIVLGLLRASREGNWHLHLICIKKMIPWCFAHDNLNYAKYLSENLSEMTHIDKEHPEMSEYFENGGFSVQIGEENPFGRIPVDQACEETVNKDTQTQGGTKGFSLKPRAVYKYYLIAEYRSIFLRQLKDMLNLSASGSQHNDLQESRIKKDEADVKSLVSLLESNWIDPFQSEQELACLKKQVSTGKIVLSSLTYYKQMK